MTPAPMGQLRRTARPDVALRQRNWTMAYPCWWSHPTLGTRLTLAEAWARTVASEAKAAATAADVEGAGR